MAASDALPTHHDLPLLPATFGSGASAPDPPTIAPRTRIRPIKGSAPSPTFSFHDGQPRQLNGHLPQWRQREVCSWWLVRVQCSRRTLAVRQRGSPVDPPRPVPSTFTSGFVSSPPSAWIHAARTHMVVPWSDPCPWRRPPLTSSSVGPRRHLSPPRPSSHSRPALPSSLWPHQRHCDGWLATHLPLLWRSDPALSIDARFPTRLPCPMADAKFSPTDEQEKNVSTARSSSTPVLQFDLTDVRIVRRPREVRLVPRYGAVRCIADVQFGFYLCTTLQYA